jgi:hypothetical protein
VICRNPLDPALYPATTHPNCLFEELSEDPAAQQLKSELIEIIKWYDRRNPRASQVPLGPSEIGTPCDRRLAYRIAEVPAINTDTDPWAAIIGTAMHSWLDAAISSWCTDQQGECEWLTETPVVLDDFIQGRSDLYNRSRAMVIDHKGAGPDVMRKILKHGPPPGYVVQVQLYGLGYEKLGYPVKKVALAFYPRAGWLKNMYVWVTDYDRNVAQAAIDRVGEVAELLIEKNVLANPHRFEQIPAYRSNDCGFCPWYDPGRDPERGATETGCPGR